MDKAFSSHCIHELRTRLLAHADQSRAAWQYNYMKRQFPFLGVRRPIVRAITKEAINEWAVPANDYEYDRLIRALLEQPEREFHHAACDLACIRVKHATVAFASTFEHLLTTHAWWDTVDTIAVHGVGVLVARMPEYSCQVDSWIDHSSQWFVRTALIYQLTYKHKTDSEKLFNHCAATLDKKEFFIRKAIGWALRTYSKTNPDAVKTFVTHHRADMSAVSFNEVKHLL